MGARGTTVSDASETCLRLAFKVHARPCMGRAWAKLGSRQTKGGKTGASVKTCVKTCRVQWLHARETVHVGWEAAEARALILSSKHKKREKQVRKQ